MELIALIAFVLVGYALNAYDKRRGHTPRANQSMGATRSRRRT